MGETISAATPEEARDLIGAIVERVVVAGGSVVGVVVRAEARPFFGA